MSKPCSRVLVCTLPFGFAKNPLTLLSLTGEATVSSISITLLCALSAQSAERKGASIDYQLKVSFTKNVPSKDGQSLDSTARIMLFDNEITSMEHKYTVYAKESASGEKEAIASELDLAEKFEGNDVVTTLTIHNFQPDEMRRYTYVLWLEGSDPDSNGPAPENAYLKLGIDINAQLSN